MHTPLPKGRRRKNTLSLPSKTDSAARAAPLCQTAKERQPFLRAAGALPLGPPPARPRSPLTALRLFGRRSSPPHLPSLFASLIPCAAASCFPPPLASSTAPHPICLNHFSCALDSNNCSRPAALLRRAWHRGPFGPPLPPRCSQTPDDESPLAAQRPSLGTRFLASRAAPLPSLQPLPQQKNRIPLFAIYLLRFAPRVAWAGRARGLSRFPNRSPPALFSFSHVREIHTAAPPCTRVGNTAANNAPFRPKTRTLSDDPFEAQPEQTALQQLSLSFLADQTDRCSRASPSICPRHPSL